MNLQPLQSNLKVLQEQQTQPQHSMFWGVGLTLSSRGNALFALLDSVLCLYAIVHGLVFRIRAADISVRGSKSLPEPSASLFRVVVKGAQSATVGDFPGLIDDVNTLRPPAVSQIGGFVHVIYGNRQREVEALDEVVSNGDALRKRLRLRIANALVHVTLHLPFVLGMRFANINGQEVRLGFVIVVKVYEVAYLAAERRSGVTSENQDKRSLADAVAEMKFGLTVEVPQRDVGGAVADVEIAAMPLRKGIAQEAVHVTRAAHEMAQHAITDGENCEQCESCPLPLTQDHLIHLLAASNPTGTGRCRCDCWTITFDAERIARFHRVGSRQARKACLHVRSL